MARTSKRSHYGERFSRSAISLRGSREVAAALRQVGQNVEEAAKAALKQGADDIVREAKSRCHVYAETKVKAVTKKHGEKTYTYFDKRMKPGQLRDSIHAIEKEDGTFYEISADAKVETSKGSLYYGAIVEFSPKINAPFLYPALDKLTPSIYRNIARAIKTAVEWGKVKHG